MRTLFLINSLQRNGAERVAINLLSFLSKNNPQDRFSLYLLEDTDNPLPIPENVKYFMGGTGLSSNDFKFTKEAFSEEW